MFHSRASRYRVLQIIPFGLSGCASLSLYSGVAFSLDESRLWLPKSHENRYLELKSAAVHAESLDKCHKVLRATIDFDQSTLKNPVYRVLCRKSDGKTYNEMVEPNKPPPSADAIKKRENERKAAMFEQCVSGLKRKTALFNQRVLDTENSKYLHFEMSGALIDIPFDAQTQQGQKLHYKAKCTIKWGEIEKIAIRKRR